MSTAGYKWLHRDSIGMHRLLSVLREEKLGASESFREEGAFGPSPKG